MTQRSYQRLLLAGVACLAFSAGAQAEFIGNSQGGTDFPQGGISFADMVVNYSPGLVGSNPSLPYRGSENALGLPDYAGGSSCSSSANCSFVALGRGGSVTLAFVDNKLTGSNSNAFDLWVFEIGPDVEDTFVEISSNGSDWFAVGKVFGSTAGIDIDAYGYGSTSSFGYVRLTDDPAEGARTGITVGADIDAVGAISTIASPVPMPPTAWLFMAGLGYAGLMARRNKSRSD